MVLEHYGVPPLQMVLVTCLLPGNTLTREWKDTRPKHYLVCFVEKWEDQLQTLCFL